MTDAPRGLGGGGSQGSLAGPDRPGGAAPRGRAPIADVAGAIAGEAAAEEIGAAMIAARAEGRLVLELPLEALDAGYLLRDRLPEAGAAGGEEMDALVASIRASGQRAPVEAVELGDGRYGLVSGWRRLAALRHLAGEGAGPGTVRAIVRPAPEAAESYLAMVEENEIRAPLSFWERARLVARAAEAGVFEDEAAALRRLFAAAPRAKRSKIGAFLPVVAALEGALPFPAALTERAGLALSKAIREAEGFGPALAARLRAAPPASAQAQAGAIEAALRGETAAGLAAAGLAAGLAAGAGSEAGAGDDTAPESPRAARPALDLRLRRESGRLVIEGPDAMDPALETRLRRWLGVA